MRRRREDRSSSQDSDVYVMGRTRVERTARQEHRRSHKKHHRKSSDQSQSESDSESNSDSSESESESEDSASSESDSDSQSRQKRRDKRQLRRQLSASSVSSDETQTNVETTTVWQKNRIPYFDEYLFVCQKWLALDEADGKIQREFKPKTVTTFFKVLDQKT